MMRKCILTFDRWIIKFPCDLFKVSQQIWNRKRKKALINRLIDKLFYKFYFWLQFSLTNFTFKSLFS